MPPPVQADPSFGLGVTAEVTGVPRSRVSKFRFEDVPVNASTIPAIPLPQFFTTYEKTSQMLYRSALSMNLLIAKFVGRILYHLSASNWSAVFMRIKNKIYALANNSEDNPDVLDLQLISHSLLDKARLVQVLQGM
jgi:neurofibromin 1